MTDSKRSSFLPLFAVAGVMLVGGIALGFFLGRRPAPPTPASPISAPAVVAKNQAGGQLKQLDEREKKELLGKKPGATPASSEPGPNSPFMTTAIVADLQSDPEKLASWKQAVALMEQGNARAAKPILGQIEAASGGRSYRDAAEVLLVEARVSTGEVEGARTLLTTWRKQFPSSSFQAQAVVSEGKALMQEGKRVPNPVTGGPLPKATADFYRQAIAQWDAAAKRWPADPAVADGLFHKIALLAELGDPAGAEQTALALLDSHPTARNTPRGVWNAGKAAYDRGEWAAAERLFDRLVKDYPQDRVAQNARSSLQSLRILGKPAPDLEIAEWLGNDYGGLDKLRGKVVVLIFWATWCPHCRNEMPHVEEQLWQKWKDDGVVVLAVTKHSKGQTTESVREYIGSNGLTVPVAIDTGGTSRAFGVSGIPASVIIDKKGNVAFQNHPAQITDALLQKLVRG